MAALKPVENLFIVIREDKNCEQRMIIKAINQETIRLDN